MNFQNQRAVEYISKSRETENRENEAKSKPVWKQRKFSETESKIPNVNNPQEEVYF